MSVQVGDRAPDFVLDGVHRGRRSPYRLSDLRGRSVVLVLYPGDDTPVCTRQLTSYTDDLSSFAEVEAEVLAVSPQGLDSHEAFAARHGLQVPLLADPDKATFSAYGALGPLGFPRRSAFVIDAEGIVCYAHRAVAGLTFRSSAELVAAVRAAGRH